MNPPNFLITGLSDYADHPERVKMKNQQCYKIIWIKRGQGICSINLNRFPVSGNSVSFILPGIPYFLEPINEMEGYVVQFDLECLYLLEITFAAQLIKYRNHPDFSYNVMNRSEEMMKLGFIVETLFIEYNSFGLQKPRILSGWISILLQYMFDLLPDAEDETDGRKSWQVMTRFYTLLEKNFHLKKTVADYANELHIVPEHLTFISKQVSGYPTSHHIKQRILLEAKRLALYSDESMKSIAYRLGFEEPAHFSKFFKINCGKNFRDFKRSCTVSMCGPALAQ